MDWTILYQKAQDRAYENAEQVGILMGHMTNAVIGLQSGDTKAEAIEILNRGIALVEKRQAPMREQADKIRAAIQQAKQEPEA